MNNIFRIMIVIFFSMIVLCGCKEKTNSVVVETEKLNITATFFPPYDFIRQITGDRVNLIMLLSPGTESHSFEPSPRDIITIRNSDIFIYNGGEADSWVDKILESTDTENMKIFTLMEMVEVLEEEIVEGMEQDPADCNECEHHHHHHRHEQTHEHSIENVELDEHVWTSPKNAILIVRQLVEILGELDAVNADFYHENALKYIEALEKLDESFDEVISKATRRTIVFGDRFPFRYLAYHYGLEYFAAFPGCSTETEPSAQTVAFLINKIRTEQIPVVFHIELSNERMANTISQETGAKKLLLHSAHNVTRNDFEAGITYLELMKRNLVNLNEALLH